MKIEKPKVLFFDIETSPCLAWVWSTGKQRVNPGQIMEATRIICISYKFEGDKKVHNLRWDKNKCDKQMVKEFSKIAESADMIMGHNGKNFDVKHLNSRVAYHRLAPLSLVTVEDTLLLSRRTFRLPSHSLDYISKYFEIGGKLSTGGIQLWLDIWLDNCPKAMKKMVKYCDQDVRLLEKVYLRLKPYLPTKTNYATFNRDNRICPSCAGTLHKHDKRFTSPMRQVQRYRCKDCCKVITDGVNLLKKLSQYPR